MYKTEGKSDYTLLCLEMLDPVVRVLEKGIPKHGRENYLTNPAVTDRELVAATIRHALACTRNPLAIDDGVGGTNEPHIACVIANGLMLLHRWAISKAALKEE